MRGRSLLAVHAAVLLFGLSGLFAKWLDLPPLSIVWWRSFLAALFLALAAAVAKKQPFAVDRKTACILVVMGGALAAHWVSFFAAIRVSTVAIGLLGFSTFPAAVALLEPLVLREKLRTSALACSALALFGVALVIPSLSLEDAGTAGALIGVASGVLYAGITVLNRRFVKDLDALSLGLWQNAVACLALVPFGPRLDIDAPTFALLSLLGIVFTGGAHALFIHGLRGVPARLAGLIGALEPVYGVAAAAVLLDEIPTARALLGGALVVAAVALASRRERTLTPLPAA